LFMNFNDAHYRSPRWRYLLLTALILVLAGAAVVIVWQLPSLFPQLETATATAAPVPTSAPLYPLIADLKASVDDSARTITFQVVAQAPPDRQIAEALLWYDTEAGHQARRFAGPLPAGNALEYRLDATQEGLTTTLPGGELDYWWLVRDTSGAPARAGGTVALGPAWQALAATPTPEPPPVDFTWAVSSTQHFTFTYVAGTEAERDLPQIAAMAKAGLAYITPTLGLDLDGKLTIYLTPRVFWQGGAAYGSKINLISYLDRNYTAIETWTYFTHEGTHVVANGLIQPKEEGWPDGVLVEGLALWATGGHYRLEPMDDLAAIIADSDSYIPLSTLRAGPFYDFQHETSYMEAGSFVQFLIKRYGLDRLKLLYGQETGKAEEDEPLVESLYGKSYAELEAEWLEYLDSLSPTPEQAEAWGFNVRYFDLMRRYQTELDPDARILPGVPTNWTSSTLSIFTRRIVEPVNVVFETTLIAAQEQADQGDMVGANALLDDIEAGLEAKGEMIRPSLQARQAICDLLAAQDRAILRADFHAYQATLAPAGALGLEIRAVEEFRLPLTSYWQEIVRLEIADDGQSATGVVLVHGRTLDGELASDGQLFAIKLVKAGDRWLLSNREPTQPEFVMPPRSAQ
ncbi:MAG: hypothetical protein JXM73_09695, partial [Anaerolineae bacterium]|nr:hypothetical protein [Anaerolineae bacterium]